VSAVSSMVQQSELWIDLPAGRHHCIRRV